MSSLLLLPAIFWLILSGLLNTFSEYLSKYWAINKDWRLLLLIALFSAASSITWLPALLHKNQIAIMFIGWLVITTTTTLLIAFFVFDETLSTQQWAGVGLGVISVLLLGI